jgi:hypothetical protein
VRFPFSFPVLQERKHRSFSNLERGNKTNCGLLSLFLSKSPAASSSSSVRTAEPPSPLLQLFLRTDPRLPQGNRIDRLLYLPSRFICAHPSSQYSVRWDVILPSECRHDAPTRSELAFLFMRYLSELQEPAREYAR